MAGSGNQQTAFRGVGEAREHLFEQPLEYSGRLCRYSTGNTLYCPADVEDRYFGRL